MKRFKILDEMKKGLSPYQLFEIDYWERTGIARLGKQGNKAVMEGYLKKLNSLFPLPENPDMVMDVGCGPYGGMSLAYKAKHWILVDILNHVYKFIVERNPDCEYLECPCEDIPLKDETLDIIFSTNSLDHTENRLKCMSEIYRLLKPSGIFALVVHCRTKEQLNRGHSQAFTPEELLKELLSMGFLECKYLTYEKGYLHFAGIAIK